jgi:hypothetical protein
LNKLHEIVSNSSLPDSESFNAKMKTAIYLSALAAAVVLATPVVKTKTVAPWHVELQSRGNKNPKPPKRKDIDLTTWIMTQDLQVSQVLETGGKMCIR